MRVNRAGRTARCRLSLHNRNQRRPRRGRKGKAAKDLEDNAGLFKQGIKTVQKFAKPRPLGEGLMRGASECMAAARA